MWIQCVFVSGKVSHQLVVFDFSSSGGTAERMVGLDVPNKDQEGGAAISSRGRSEARNSKREVNEIQIISSSFIKLCFHLLNLYQEVRKELIRKAKLSIHQSPNNPTLTYGDELCVVPERRRL